jgi:hypothetical protein
MLSKFPRSVLLILLWTCACQARRTVPLAPDQSGELPKRSVLVKKGGDRVSLEEGRVSGDSVIGVRRNGERISIPRDSVALEQTRLKVGTALGITAFTLAGLFGLMAWGYSSEASR